MKECQQCKQCYPDTVAICPDDGMPTFHSIAGEPLLEGKYKLDKRLGQGGMGVVYCARHAYLKTQHAIKVILPDLVGNDPQLVTRFRQEALAAAAIRHHNVIAVTDFGVAQGTMPFLVMEFVEGESLHDLLSREHRLSPARAAELMSAICAGVGAAHRQGIVHRDLKPLNIMIQKDRHSMAEAVKILDFGLAKIKSGELLGSFVQAQTTGLMGSPYYMAPEQWADEDPDAAADVYSLGIMLFQMIAGDVPFKGSSIPAIMKKHLSDLPPSFAEFGVQVSPQFELAVRHTLEKDRHKRTQGTEELIEELRSAIGISSQSFNIHTSQTARQAAPVSTLHILTKPPKSKVFVDSVSIGESQHDGYLLLEGLQSGNHRVRISHEGFHDWESEVVCDGSPQQVIAELKNFSGTIPPPSETMNFHPSASQNFSATQGSSGAVQQTMPIGSQSSIQQSSGQNWHSSQQNAAFQPVAKKSMFSPLMLAITGILGVLLLTGIGIGGAFMSGLIGRTGNDNSGANKGFVPPANTNVQPTPLKQVKNEMVKIPGGKFRMGRDDGEILERPAHEVEVKDFWMDKTEVTNAEFYEFIREKGYSPIPANWERGKPLPNEEMMPVRYVNSEDIEAFIKWRSERDGGAAYRLPTEAEWEYAARNGEENNLYPWGDKWEEGRAVINREFIFEPVESKPNGANKWGVLGLLGNVWEWTSTEPKSYPGAEKQLEIKDENTFLVVRGAFSLSKEALTANSTFRAFSPAKKRDKVIGFRLVRSDNEN